MLIAIYLVASPVIRAGRTFYLAMITIDNFKIWPHIVAALESKPCGLHCNREQLSSGVYN